MSLVALDNLQFFPERVGQIYMKHLGEYQFTRDDYDVIFKASGGKVELDHDFMLICNRYMSIKSILE